MNDAQEQTSATNATAQDAPQREPRIDWDNPNTPAGDAPAMPRWPLMLSIVVYGGWLVFLVVMAYMRMHTTDQ